MPPSPRFLSSSEVAARIGIPLDTLQARIRRHAFVEPDAFIGSSRGWSPSTVDRWLDEHDDSPVFVESDTAAAAISRIRYAAALLQAAERFAADPPTSGLDLPHRLRTVAGRLAGELDRTIVDAELSRGIADSGQEYATLPAEVSVPRIPIESAATRSLVRTALIELDDAAASLRPSLVSPAARRALKDLDGCIADAYRRP